MQIPEDAKLVNARVWKGGELPFMELAALWRSGRDHILHGHVIGLRADVPFALRYRVECDAAWCTRRVWVELDTPPQVRELHITVNAAQQWIVNGEHHRGLDGLLDVDIQVSPSTNTLPIRRLQMGPGRTHAVTAAWIKVPGLEMERITQHYTCIDAHHLHYRSGDFTAELEVDALGLIERYGRFWHRIDPH